MLESIADAYLAIDAHDVIQDANPAAAALLRLPHSSLVGNPLARFFLDALASTSAIRRPSSHDPAR